MLTATPIRDDREALVRTAAWLSWPGWDRFLLGWCAAFHLAVAAAMAAVPYDLLLTEGTRPVLELAPPRLWSVVFAAAAALSWWLLRDRRPAVQMSTWLVVSAIGGTWTASIGLAVLRGDGSPVLLLFTFALYGLWAVLAVVVGLERR